MHNMTAATITDEKPEVRGLAIPFYPARIADDEIEGLIELAFHGWERAPTFCGWLATALQGELMRRLEILRGNYHEVELLTVPMDWSDQELVDALQVASALTYSVGGFMAGKLIDQVTAALTVLISRRLLRRKSR